MLSTKFKTFALAVGAAALMAPVAAAEKPAPAPAKEQTAKKKGHAKAKNAVFRGTVVSVDPAAGSMVVKVSSANRWGRRFDEQEVAFTTAGVKKIKVADANADGKRDLADVKPGDRVHVQARITREAAPPLAARKLAVKAPQVEEEAAPASPAP